MKTFRSAFMTGLVLQLLTGPIHLIGFFSGPPPPASEDQRLLMELMSSVRQDLGGGFVLHARHSPRAESSVQHLHRDGGLTNLFALRQVKDGRFLRTLSWLNALFMAILAVNAYVYFFIPPLLLFVLPALAFLVAGWSARSSE